MQLGESLSGSSALVRRGLRLNVGECRKTDGGGGGSRTRVRKRSAWNVYVRSPIGTSRRPPPEGADERPASPVVFAFGPRAGPRAIPLFGAHPGPRGRRTRRT